jgi:hypothetical protein
VARRKEPRPFTLIAWRKYSAIGYSEIERAREEFLAEPVREDLKDGDSPWQVPALANAAAALRRMPELIA